MVNIFDNSKNFGGDRPITGTMRQEAFCRDFSWERAFNPAKQKW
jgi:hypothetical protein